jgi:hypothetical protein
MSFFETLKQLVFGKPIALQFEQMILEEEARKVRTPEPVAEVVPEPVAEVVPEPVVEPVAEVVPEVVPEPVAEVVPEPVVEPVAEPVAEVVPEPVVEPVVKVAPKRTRNVKSKSVASVVDDKVPAKKAVKRKKK